MELFRPNQNLLTLGFNLEDINYLNQILDLMNIKLIDDDNNVFDFNYLVIKMLKDEVFLNKFLKLYQELIPDLELYLLTGIGFDVASYHFKWYLFLLLLLHQDQYSSEIKVYLVSDEAYHKTYYSIFDIYFLMRRKHYDSLNNIFNLISKSNELERTGWLNANIPTNHKESIAEHMFNMYHLAKIYLKDDYEISEYDKKKILDMIMVHDLAENIIGDIAHPKKTIMDEIREDVEGKALFLGILINNHDSSYFDLWCEWSENKTINAMIAHDIDVLQFNYQFMTYASLYPNHFSDDEIRLWMRRHPKTLIGEELYQELIINNPKFKEKVGALIGK